MQTAPIPANEKERLEAVHQLAILDTKPEERFDLLTREAVNKLKVPISTVSILDEKREWFKSCVGLDKKEGERAVSFCGHALLATNIFIIEDTLKDPRFADNPMVVGSPFIRFYAGMALFDHKTRHPIGVFCVKDTKPRKLNAEEISILIDIAERAEKELKK
ncbi:MAG: GAF domain-containing protein [Candidatus Pacebacteria bacterium]|nr:GAF domain-containing protein [Candidatus Paceibacterota bacterium]